jgi:predicted metalloprotease with PDZ domain
VRIVIKQVFCLLIFFTSMQYTLSYNQPEKHYIDIEVVADNIDSPAIEVQLPAWRPGRYELANFAKNMTKLYASSQRGEHLPVSKITKDRWQVHTAGNTSVRLNYRYYAQQMDAGGSWLDEHQLYVNFINCMIYVEGRLEEECIVRLLIPGKLPDSLRNGRSRKTCAPGQRLLPPGRQPYDCQQYLNA